ncbi:MAG: hypothetical protein KC457_32755, partial [Myxococcales bacterium]|nr:hypothetical protein [Myxococcales bacterium]
MGWIFVDREVPWLPALEHETDEHSLFVAKLEPYHGGVLVFGRHVRGETEQLWPKWHTGVHFLADADAELETVRRDDCEQIHDALTLGETTHWLCRNGSKGEFWLVLDEAPGTG